MKRKIAIIGAGHAGLQLGIGLLQQGHNVLFVSDKTPEQIIAGSPTSSQGMFTTALSFEAELGLNYWDDICPYNKTVNFKIIDPNNHKVKLQWRGQVSGAFRSVDQRIKFPRWMHEAEKLGAEFSYQTATVEYADQLTEKYDLVLLATGKGAISSLLERDDQKSIFTTPQRALALIYAKNIKPAETSGVRIHVIPDVGEYSVIPGLGLNGPCEMMLFEGIINGPFDCWSDIQDPEEYLKRALSLLQKYLPVESKRYSNAELSDPRGILQGAYTPIVRKPLLKLPSGRYILGMADAVVLNDPIAGQGSNNASKCANLYLKEIVGLQSKKFSEQWMQETFNKYWEKYGKHSTDLTNMLLSPPSESLLNLLSLAQRNKITANLLANGFDRPEEVFSLLYGENTSTLFTQKNEKKLSKVA